MLDTCLCSPSSSYTTSSYTLLLHFSGLLSCSLQPDIYSNKWQAVTEMVWSNVTQHTRELFSKSGSRREKKCNRSNFLHPASDIPLTVYVRWFGPQLWLCVIHSCTVEAYRLAKTHNTMALISPMQSNDWESMDVHGKSTPGQACFRNAS